MVVDDYMGVYYNLYSGFSEFKAGLSFLVSCFVMLFFLNFFLAWYRTMIWYCTVHHLCAISAMFIEEIQGTVSRWFRFCPWETAKCGKSHGRIQGWWCAEESWARLACPVLQTTSDWSSNAGGSELEEMDLQATNYQPGISLDKMTRPAWPVSFFFMKFSWGWSIMISGISYPLSTYIMNDDGIISWSIIMMGYIHYPGNPLFHEGIYPLFHDPIIYISWSNNSFLWMISWFGWDFTIFYRGI